MSHAPSLEATWSLQAIGNLGDQVLLGCNDEACTVDLVTGAWQHHRNGQSFVKHTCQAWIPYDEPLDLGTVHVEDAVRVVQGGPPYPSRGALGMADEVRDLVEADVKGCREYRGQAWERVDCGE